MFLGIDLGTSGLKAVLLDRAHQVRASATAPLTVQQPQPLWREQQPADWWQACEEALAGVLRDAAAQGIAARQIEAIGLSGQMHGATLLDAGDQVLRPAILWNDGRSHGECAELERRVPASRQITGNQMMPGFTAPKLLWVARHEPQVFERIAKVLLPKDYLRLRLTGQHASDLSDAAGTLWLDMAGRDWSDELLAATGLARQQMPTLHEGPEITGHLRAEVAQKFGLRRIPVVAGAGDNAAGAIGMGIVQPGQAMLSLGTSGVFFVATDGFLANPAQGVHSFCHALPRTWHLMSVMLSAASCLDHTQRLTGQADVPSLLAAAQRRGISDATPYYLPYLSGERTPHNNPAAKAVFFGLDSATEGADLGNATLEGVGQGLLDGIEAVEASGVRANQIVLVGGGSRSDYWAQMLSNIVNRPLIRREGGDFGPALGAARLARLGVDGGSVAESCPVPTSLGEFLPAPEQHARHAQRRKVFHRLYRQLEPLYSST
ncbi:MAG: xylulokinase [Rhodoferax sp.]|uniref:xylulokinase n=1 Tax=Rhodoferax sp. TaxID=50421 RepID=UPI00262BB9B9|nr:xylulokinase [Rhodoferax sp.]MDD5332746.1 xylulokinase [Rhodoferax sp.]